MRIAYLLKKFPRLSETFILNEILAQEEWASEVPVYSRRAPDDEPRHPSIEAHKGTVHVLPSTRNIDPWRTLFRAGDPGRAERILAVLRRVTEELDEYVGERLPSLIAEALYLLDRTREDGVDHLHVHFATESAVTALILSLLGGPSYSLTAHAKDIYRETVQPCLLDKLVAGSRFTVTVCDANVAHMRAMIGPAAARRLRRLYNGIDLASFRVDGATPARRPREILAVGRLVEKKGFDVLLTALAQLRDEAVEFEARFVGDGDARAALQAQATALRLDEHVTFLGPQDQDFVRDTMRRARVFALPCVIGEDGNRDALPTVLVEAIALGLPCVSTPVTGIPEILVEPNLEAGLIVPERDAPATAKAIRKLLDDEDLWGRLAANGRRHAEVQFDRGTQGAILRQWFLEATADEIGVAG